MFSLNLLLIPILMVTMACYEVYDGRDRQNTGINLPKPSSSKSMVGYLLILLAAVVVGVREAEGQASEQRVEPRARAVEGHASAATHASPREAHALARGTALVDGC